MDSLSYPFYSRSALSVYSNFYSRDLLTTFSVMKIVSLFSVFHLSVGGREYDEADRESLEMND